MSRAIKALTATLALLALSGCVLKNLSVDSVVKSRPINFTCPELADFTSPEQSFLFADLRTWAYSPDDPRHPSNRPSFNATDNLIAGTPALIDPYAYPARQALQDADKPIEILVLSGGGQWGAFGAGFLSEKGVRRNWDLVTGISTGALQSLFVGAGEYEAMKQAYGISVEGELAKPNGFFGTLRKGSQYDTAALREKVMRTLLDEKEGGLLDKINEGRGPPIEIGMVNASTGDFIVVRVTDMIRAGYREAVVDREHIATCVTAVSMASSSVPLRLTPVRINGTAYLDGGVRASGFIRTISARASLTYASNMNLLSLEGEPTADTFSAVAPPRIYVIRNGPTVVPQGPREGIRDPEGDDEDIRPFKVDLNPSAYRTALRGYATLVNQNEMTSITTLLLEYPFVPLQFASADGYNWLRNPGCGERPEDKYFDPKFMQCLISWGEERATRAEAPSGWLSIAGPNSCQTDDGTVAEECIERLLSAYRRTFARTR